MLRYCLTSLVIVAMGCGAAARASKLREEQGDDARNKWRVVHDQLEQAGNFIAQHKFDEAVARLKRLERELPGPYRDIPREVLSKLQSGLAQIEAKKAGEDPFGSSYLLSGTGLARLCRRLHAHRAAAKLFRSALEANPPPDDRRHDTTLAPSLLGCLLNLDADLGQLDIAYKNFTVDKPVAKELWHARMAAERELRKGENDLKFLKEVFRLRDRFYRLRMLQRMIAEPMYEKHRIYFYEESARTLHELGDRAGRDAWEAQILKDFSADITAVEKVLSSRCSRARTDEDFETVLAAYRRHSAELPKPGDSFGLQLVRRIYKLEEEQRWKKAVELNRRILKQIPDSYHANFAQHDLADCLAELGKHREAVAEYKKALDVQWEEVRGKGLGLLFAETLRGNMAYDAARGLSASNEALGNMDEAVKWAIAVRDDYPYSASCMLAISGAASTAQAEVVRLMFKSKRTADALRLCEHEMFDPDGFGSLGDDDEWNDVLSLLVNHYRDRRSLMELETKLVAAQQKNRRRLRAEGRDPDSVMGSIEVARTCIMIRRLADAKDVAGLWKMIPWQKRSAMEITAPNGLDDVREEDLWPVRKAIEALVALPEASGPFFREKLKSPNGQRGWAFVLLVKLKQFDDIKLIGQELQRIAKLKDITAQQEEKLEPLQRDCYYAMMLIDGRKGMEILENNMKSSHLHISGAANYISTGIELGESKFYRRMNGLRKTPLK